MINDIVPAHLAVQAMRDNGYKNAAYAIAELIDNSIQAGASSIEVLCSESKDDRGSRSTYRVEHIGVLDNGKGMDEGTLQIALQFGNGTYLDFDKHNGIGRYGMGLPCSSISQCKKVEVWTWQTSPSSAIYSYLDLDKIKDKVQTEIPKPINKKIPTMWSDIAKSIGNSGTLVVWSNIDRCMWRTAKSIIKHSELIIGRMYRYFLQNDKIKIRMAYFDISNHSDVVEKYALPNDPIYLMEKTSCPAPFDKKPMFQPDGERYEIKYPIKYRDQQHDVLIKFSYAKPEARTGANPGGSLHGKHAAKNIGVSIVRAGRELELETGWVNTYDPTERFWGVEVAFPPALDEIFGVTNNKQSARYFSDISMIDIDDECKKNSISKTELIQDMKRDGDISSYLHEISDLIRSRLSAIRGMLKVQTVGTRASRKRQYVTAENIATVATRDRQNVGKLGASDADETQSIELRKRQVAEELKELGNTNETIESIIDETFSADGILKYIFSHANIESPAFFTVKPRGGELIISLNTNHPAYDKLFNIIEENIDTESPEDLRMNFLKAQVALKLILAAWARFEDEQDGYLRDQLKEIRYDWGRITREFLSGE